MKLKKIFSILIVLIFIASVNTSCSKDESDNNNPEINLISPMDHDEFHPGDMLFFEADFSDDTELKQFKIDIHFNDGHEHKSESGVNDEWDFEYIGELAGKSQNIQMEVEIPEDADHGHYHFMVFCTDIVGNESFVSIEIEIEEDHE